MYYIGTFMALIYKLLIRYLQWLNIHSTSIPSWNSLALKHKTSVLSTMENGKELAHRSWNLSTLPLKNSSQSPILLPLMIMRKLSRECLRPSLNGLKCRCQREAKLSGRSVWHSGKTNRLSVCLFLWKWVRSSQKELEKFKRQSMFAIWLVDFQDRLGMFFIYFSGSVFNSERPDHFMM